jgi:hypothetical protein
MPDLTTSCVYVERDGGWRAIWRGQLAAPHFNSKGAALAYLATCDHAGKLRS